MSISIEKLADIVAPLSIPPNLYISPDDSKWILFTEVDRWIDEEDIFNIFLRRGIVSFYHDSLLVQLLLMHVSNIMQVSLLHSLYGDR